ncbi:hypothetical protein DRF65_05815 [Chryseobacterium pennae]|uniref:Uncharacterized protein n=2 Tax=Chryseobacterium TaxID=59732 RepID=A0A3D9CBN5_9FLAO|nr:hypothetical protein [Chryseobacterium pennae]REC63169.1 hypothetical protein DRF65_05815 [Chryseobacterium pennae]
MAKIPTYTVDPAKRRILTVENMEELGITDELIKGIMNKKLIGLTYNQVNENGQEVKVNDKVVELSPIGISINDRKFGNFPDPNAAKRGWMAFFEIGAPLFEERSNIIQPVADILSTRSYENRSDLDRQFSDNIEFTVGNTINWTLAGMGSSTFGGKIAGELQGQISKTIETILTESLSNSLAKYDSNTITKTKHLHNHKDNQGTQSVISAAAQSATTKTTNFTFTNSNRLSYTGTGTAIGRGELSADLGLSLTGTISGTLTTAWKSNSNVSGSIPKNSRVETLATQRRQVKQFTYEIPITFDGYIGLNFEELVNPYKKSSPPRHPMFTKDIGIKTFPVHISALELLAANDKYRAKGMAEKVSALDVNHTIFETKQIPNIDSSKETFSVVRPHNL